MDKHSRRRVKKLLTHMGAVVLGSILTFLLCQYPFVQTVISGIHGNTPVQMQPESQTQETADSGKLTEMEKLIQENFIGETDLESREDDIARGLIASLGDRWSFYLSADEYVEYLEQMENAYIGVGMTISGEEKDGGFEVLQVEPNGGAREAGVVPGDILLEVEGQIVTALGMEGTRNLVRGEENTSLTATFLRNGERLTLEMSRKVIQTPVAEGQLLDGKVGLVTIANFDDRCTEETVAAIESLIAQGATSLVFDVRFNPGGYRHELVKILDYLLPEGVIFRSIDQAGVETVENSDADCIQMPMAVLVNESSYSAAEFFAAALQEYDWAVVVGEQTVGKSYFQNTFQLSDGSAMNLSVGKYCTPKGVSLAEVGGLTPDVEVAADQAKEAEIYAGLVEAKDDPQIQKAISAISTQYS